MDTCTWGGRDYETGFVDCPNGLWSNSWTGIVGTCNYNPPVTLDSCNNDCTLDIAGKGERQYHQNYNNLCADDMDLNYKFYMGCENCKMIRGSQGDIFDRNGNWIDPSILTQNGWTIIDGVN